MLRVLAPSTDPQSLGFLFRKRRFKFFDRLLKPIVQEKKIAGKLPVRILDIGGLESFWDSTGLLNNDDFHITFANLRKMHTKSHNVESVIGDATNLPFEDKSFDIVFSNSVIEHLYSYENQVKMATEASRVGKHYFIQTPNRHFFLEPHYLLPFFQYLPKSTQLWILLKTKLSRGYKWSEKAAKGYISQVQLLTRKQMRSIFPGSHIYNERFIGMTKSFAAHNFPLPDGSEQEYKR